MREPIQDGSKRLSWLLRHCCLAVVFLQPAFADADETIVPAADVDGADARQAVERYCFGCHSGDQPAASLDLTDISPDRAIIEKHAVWSMVLDRLRKGDMPPADAPEKMPDVARTAVADWLDKTFEAEAERNANDPGRVPPRRLSNAEFDNCIRDLTGVDLRPTAEFPVDPANEAGFDNSAESLSMSPALMTKYVGSVRKIADHIVFTPRGLVFAPFPCVSETDRDKFCVQRIVDFYRRHEVRYDEYLWTLWKFQKLDESQRNKDALAELARTNGLSPRYLPLVWSAIRKPDPTGPFEELHNAWTKDILTAKDPDQARTACQKTAKLIRVIRDDLTDSIPQLKVNGISQGSQPLITWWNEQQANQRRTFPGDGEDADLDRARREFCEIFPNEFFVASRGHYSNGDLGANVRLLSAGFHLMQGYFRDDLPLRELVLTPTQIAELDQLWEDLEYVTEASIRQYKDFLFFERAEPPQFAAGPEFDFARPENKDVTTEASLLRMRGVYREAAEKKGASETAINAIDSYFDGINQRIRRIEQQRSSAENAHIDDLKRFAGRAWRRPLLKADEQEIDDFYHRLRDADGLTHEDAVRDSIASILLSPRFCFRLETAGQPLAATIEDIAKSQPASAVATEPLSDIELASRLSFFLWASLPDKELMALAEKKQLSTPEVLRGQIDRMLRDQKVSGFAKEFLGNWLEFRRFEEHNAVDRSRYPAFDESLRSAMFEEPLRFFVDLIQRDGRVHELIDADHTFVNSILARHYGISDQLPGQLSEGKSDSQTDWTRLDGASRFGRGGLLPMSVFLTRNSPGLRTSPVKRGYWVVRRLLGEHIPAPPPNVPELPKDETDFGKLSLAQILARHRDNVACAGCHDRFDSIGLIFEAYGPIGDHRTVDLSGNPVETMAVFPDGSGGRTLGDLKRYLIQSRRADFEDNFARKLLSYALGRSLLLSDRKTIEEMQESLRSESGSVRTAIQVIVTSPQFRMKRRSAVASSNP